MMFSLLRKIPRTFANYQENNDFQSNYSTQYKNNEDSKGTLKLPRTNY